MNEKTPAEIAEEIGSHIFSWGLSCRDLNPSDFKEEKAKAVKMLGAILRTERTAEDELRKENTRLFAFAKKAVEASNILSIDLEASMIRLSHYDKHDADIWRRLKTQINILTDPICIELLK